jgi:hypothetical protein
MTIRRTLGFLLLPALLLTACGGGDDEAQSSASAATTPTPTAATTTTPSAPATTPPTSAAVTTSQAGLSVAELQQWRGDATAVADVYWGAWPDTAIVERLADDVAFSMPSDGDFIEGKSAVGSMLRTFIGYYASAEPSVEAMFLSGDAAAYRIDFPSGLWPPWTAEPPDHPPFVILDVFRFRDTTITDYEVWLEDETLEMAEYGCFAIEGCPEGQAIVDHYIAAWTSGDIDQIAAIYADDAVFTDSLFGIEAVGPEEIGGLADERFGTGDVTFEVLNVYGQTNGYRAPTEGSPELGRVIGVGIHYRVSAGDTGAPLLESLTTFDLGTRQRESFEPDPHGRITREQIFHDPATLANLTN